MREEPEHVPGTAGGSRPERPTHDDFDLGDGWVYEPTPVVWRSERSPPQPRQHKPRYHAPRYLTRRQFIGASLLALAAATTATGVGEAYAFSLVDHRVALPGLETPVRLAFLTDLHYGPYIGQGSVAAWVDAANAVGPDLILLGGDLVDRMAGADIEPLVHHLGRLHAPLGVLTVVGNHDYQRFPRIDVLLRRLAGVGIVALRNAGTRLRDDLFVAGVDDAREGRPDLGQALASRPVHGACILVSHNPEMIRRVTADVGLTLCGHTHGGQVRLPFVGPILPARPAMRDYVEGWVGSPRLAYVSRGLGVGYVPIRLNCPAELTTLWLEPPAP